MTPCYVMLCSIVLGYSFDIHMSCLLRYAMPCRAVPRRAVPRPAMLCNAHAILRAGVLGDLRSAFQKLLHVLARFPSLIEKPWDVSACFELISDMVRCFN